MSTPIKVAIGKRARNAAAKRVGLLEAVLERLATRPLSAIPVRELCEVVGISEQTFFNTFEGKPGVLVFFVHLWSIEMQWRMHRAVSAEAELRVLFESSAVQIRRTRWLMPEIIAYQILAHQTLAELVPKTEPTLADKLQRFEDMPGIEAFDPLPIQVLIRAAVEQAIASGELPERADASLVTQLFCALFFGASASMSDPQDVAELLTRGFHTLWQGFK